MKRIMLGSLFSCMVAGQVFGAAREVNPMSTIKQLCMNRLLDQHYEPACSDPGAIHPALVPRAWLENDIATTRQRVEEATERLRQTLPEPHMLNSTQEEQERLIAGSANRLIEPFQAALRRHEEGRQYIYDGINNMPNTVQFGLGAGLGVATPFIGGLLVSLRSKQPAWWIQRAEFIGTTMIISSGLTSGSLLAQRSFLLPINYFAFGLGVGAFTVLLGAGYYV